MPKKPCGCRPPTTHRDCAYCGVTSHSDGKVCGQCAEEGIDGGTIRGTARKVCAAHKPKPGKAKIRTIAVGQGCRDHVARVLKDAKIRITTQGYTDSSTTTWGFRVFTAKTPRALQDLVWDSGIGWCDVK